MSAWLMNSQAVVAVDASDGERDLVNELVEHAQDVDMGVGAGEHPPGVDIGEVHTPAELALEGGAAVSHGIDLEEAGLGLDLVTGLA